MESGVIIGGEEERRARVADALPVALASLPLFGGLAADASAMLEQELEWLSLLGGATLFAEGDISDALYIVISGVLGVISGGGRDGGTLLAQIHPGETVGEMALLSDRPRSATIVALRDSTLLRVTKASFARLIELHPASMRFLTQLLVDRLDRTTHRAASVFVPRTLALIPLDAGVPIASFASDLARALGEAGTTVKILDARAREDGLDKLHALEKLHNLVIYRGDAADAPWTRLCIRHADRILLVASAASAPEPAAPARDIADLNWRICELVLLQEAGASVPAPAAPWLTRRPLRAHYHVRAGHKGDVARLGRYVTGRAVGLVLSGGGARGYGHVGVVKALRQAGIPIDMVGGTSFGAIVAAGVANEWDDHELRARFRKAFVESDPLRDYTFPFVALTRGREVARRLRENFGEHRLEDLWLPYFAVATNLTTGEVAVQRQGLVWQAIMASSAIPGLVPPWIAAGEVLVDGAVMNNLPVDVMNTISRGPIIAVDVARYLNLRPTAPTRYRWLRRWLGGEETAGLGIVSLLLSSAATASDAQARLCRELADFLLEPPLTDIGLRDWKAFDRAVEDAYRYTMERIEAIERACGAGAR